MTLLYNPKTRKPHPWIIVIFILIPVFLLAVLLLVGENLPAPEGESTQTQDQDIFATK